MEVRYYDFMLIIGKDVANVTADWQKISDSTNTNVVAGLVLLIIMFLHVC